MGTAKRGQKIIQVLTIGCIEHGKLDVHLVSIAVENIILSYPNIESMMRRDTRRICVGIEGAGRRNHQARGAELRIRRAN